MVLLHGWGATADLTWWWLYEPVRRLGCRALAVDHRGHGRGIASEERFSLEGAADVAALRAALQVGPAIVCGFSMGGPVALLVWDRHPERVAGLVLEPPMGVAELVLRSSARRGFVDRTIRSAIENAPELPPTRGGSRASCAGAIPPGWPTPAGPWAAPISDPSPPRSTSPRRWWSPPGTAWSGPPSSGRWPGPSTAPTSSSWTVATWPPRYCPRRWRRRPSPPLVGSASLDEAKRRER
ncbi:MAG: alpha/beta fold hydrolase [Acidimicrobiales bacterium]